ncbi:MAG: hypothetical protein QOD94_1948, partial [Alphaproteobacteria bacterium]|nr:hypothetical protein [Alphaproteobacteria bacterium]
EHLRPSQDLLRTNSEDRAGKPHQNGALLTGLLSDDKGNRMSPSFTAAFAIAAKILSTVRSALLW